MIEQRLPAVNGDDGQWGDILNKYLSKEHYNIGINSAFNGGHKAITLRPGTTAAGTAPIKLTSGPLLSASEAGAIEFLADKYYGTITTGNTRKEFAFTDDIASCKVTQATFTLSGNIGANATIKLPFGASFTNYSLLADVATTCSITVDGTTLSLANESSKDGVIAKNKQSGDYIKATVDSNSNANVINLFIKGIRQ